MRQSLVVLVSGKMGSGKSTLAHSMAKELRELNSFDHVHVERYAGPLYEMHDAVLGILSKYGVRRNLAKDGPLLQQLGTEWGRKTIDANLWMILLANKISQVSQTSGSHVFIVEDVRFKNELFGMGEKVAAAGLKVRSIRLECPEEIRKARCSMWRENTNHPSEIDLDDVVDKFDLVIDAEKLDAQRVLDAAMDFVLS